MRQKIYCQDRNAYENEGPYYGNRYTTIPLDFTIPAKNDSVAYYKSVIMYIKKKMELEKRNSDTFLISFREGQYIKGLNNYYEKSGDSTSLNINVKINIENSIANLISQNKLDLSK
jgi:hypothetical protein